VCELRDELCTLAGALCFLLDANAFIDNLLECRVEFECNLPRCSIVLLVVLLAFSGCQTTENGIANPPTSALPLTAEVSQSNSGVISIAARNIRDDDAPIVSSAGQKTSFLNGTGRFIGSPLPPSRESADKGDSTVTVNLVGVSVPQAAKAILGDILDVKYTVDPGIEGKVTIQTPQPVAKSSVIALFQTALRSNGAAVINAGDQFKIVPADQAAIGASIRLDGVQAAEDRLGSHVQIVQLQYVSASEMRRLLEPISPRGGILRADEARNTITLSGTSEEIAGMLDAISIFDIDVMKGMSFALVPVTTASPDAVADQLRDVFSSSREGPMAGMVRFIPNKQLSAILVISPQRKYLTTAAEWVRRLDAQAEGSEKQFYTYTAQNRRAQELADVLQSMFASEKNAARSSGTSRNVAPQYQEAGIQSGSQTPAFPSMSGSMGGGAMAGGGMSSGAMAQPISLPVKQNQGNTQQSAAILSSDQGSSSQAATTDPRQDPRFKIAVDEGKNSILIEATPADHRRIMNVIKTLDVMPKQVLIEVTIAEVSLNDELQFGVRWFLNKGKNTYTFTDDAGGSLASVFPGFSYALTAANIAATLNALNAITKVNVISSPSLTVMDNRTAFLQIGDEVPIITETAQSVLTTGAPLINSITYKDTGIILEITPRINASGRVLLDLQQEVSTVVPTTTSGINSPTIRQRRIQTSVVVDNGEGLALGGLIQNSDTLTQNQIPILGNIPIIGAAFRQKGDTIAKTELLIFITPMVMRTLGEARWITDEFRRELRRDFPTVTAQPGTIDQGIKRILE
jgi:general secretion pathway protein D